MILTPHSLWAYLGPETTLPLASLLGTLVGIVLIFWQFLLGFAKKLFRMLVKKGTAVRLPAPVVPAEGTATVGADSPNGADGSAA